MQYFEITKYGWLILMVYWLASSFRTKKTIHRQSGYSRILYLCLMVLGFWLVYDKNASIGWLAKRIFPPNYWDGLLGLSIYIIGIGFALMARIWLGKNWSGTVTIKRDHELIKTGPYAITRHPIYTGILFGLIGSVIVLGELRGGIALILVFLALQSKIRAEEKFLYGIFPDYRDYASYTQRLIPFIY